MKISNLQKIKDKELIVFDLDGTLVQTKSPMDEEMTSLFSKLLEVKKVAVIGGGKYQVFQELFVKHLKVSKKLLEKLFLFPTTGTAFYHYQSGWKKNYALTLTEAEVAKITKAFGEVFVEIGYKHPEKTYGKLIENRDSQVSFSVFGQDLVKVLGPKGVAMKEEWLKNNLKLKMRIAKLVGQKLPKFEVKAAGFTTIDVTKRGIDKAYGLKQMQKYLKIPIKKMFFVGDAMFAGGNDHAVIKTGVDYKPVASPTETKQIITEILRL